MNKTYNLLYEPWIPAMKKDGKIEKYGIYDIFKFSHELVDIQTPDFGGTYFPVYESLALRLLSAIYADAITEANCGYYEDEDKVSALALSSFDVSEGSPLGDYFKKYENRFDLFGDTPFMQATDEDLKLYGLKKTDPQAVMKLNPTAIAADGRLFGAGLNNEELLSVFGEKGDPLLGLVNSDINFNGSKFKEAINEYHAINPNEFIYILLFANTYAPNVRMKGGLLCDIGYVQMMKGKDLKTTIVLNSQLSDEDERNTPLWRWNSLTDGMKMLRKGSMGKIGVNACLFYPSRIIRATLSDDGKIREIFLKTIFNEDKDKKLYDDFKFYIQEQKDPYVARKWPRTINKTQKVEYLTIKGSNLGPQWMRIIETSCKNSFKEVQDILNLEGSDELLISPDFYCRTMGDGAISEYGIKSCFYYLIQGDHSKLMTSGKAEEKISEAIFTDPFKSQAIEKMCNLIRFATNSLRRYEFNYTYRCDDEIHKKKPDFASTSFKSSLTNIFLYKSEFLMGLSVKNINGYFYQVEKAESAKELDNIFEDLRKDLIETAKKVFSKIMDSTRMITYFEAESALIKSIKYYKRKDNKSDGSKE